RGPQRRPLAFRPINPLPEGAQLEAVLPGELGLGETAGAVLGDQPTPLLGSKSFAGRRIIISHAATLPRRRRAAPDVVPLPLTANCDGLFTKLLSTVPVGGEIRTTFWTNRFAVRPTGAGESPALPIFKTRS